MNLFFLQNVTIQQFIKYNHRIFPKKSGFLIRSQNQYSIFEFDGDIKFEKLTTNLKVKELKLIKDIFIKYVKIEFSDNLPKLIISTNLVKIVISNFQANKANIVNLCLSCNDVFSLQKALQRNHHIESWISIFSLLQSVTID